VRVLILCTRSISKRVEVLHAPPGSTLTEKGLLEGVGLCHTESHDLTQRSCLHCVTCSSAKAAGPVLSHSAWPAQWESMWLAAEEDLRLSGAMRTEAGGC